MEYKTRSASSPARALGLVLSLGLALSPTGLARASGKPTAAEAKAFIESVNRDLKKLQVASSRAEWVKLTYITDDTEEMSANAEAELLAYRSRVIKEAARFDKVKTDADTARQLYLLKQSSTVPAPKDPAKTQELASITSKMSSLYGKAKVCELWTAQHPLDTNKDKCLDLEELTQLLATSRQAPELKAAYKGWHATAVPLKPMYQRYVELGNEGAREIGYSDIAALWKSGYDMSPAAFETEMERLWQQVKPLYQDLQCYTKNRLKTTYPEEGLDKPYIPAHLLGNMWAQDWSNLYPLLEPFPGQSGVDVSEALKAKNYDAMKLTKLGENFFTSLGLKPLPPSFYERSMLLKPQDREVVCHASAWDITYDNDVRIKMCMQIDQDNLLTVHHELGHIYYYQYYHKLPVLYQNAAHDGFHEAIGDTMTLSVNAAYLQKVGVFDQVPPNNAEAQINALMRMALERVAFLPFGYLMDKWRWDVFSGKTPPAQYNETWWNLRRKYQGIDAPETPVSTNFDPGAKFHIPANTPYARYFLADILQFQLHRALCKAAGQTGPLYACSIYGSKEAGQSLRKLLELGSSKPWPEALKIATGESTMDASAILDYFAPLQVWLKEQNKNQTCGWPEN